MFLRRIVSAILAQVELLRKASSGQPNIDERIEVRADGSFSHAVAMRENDVWYIELSPV